MRETGEVRGQNDTGSCVSKRVLESILDLQSRVSMCPFCRDTDQTSCSSFQAELSRLCGPHPQTRLEHWHRTSQEEGRPSSTELTNLPPPPSPLMSCRFSSGTHEAVAPGSPPSGLPPEQLLAGGSRDIKGIKLPWNGFTKVPPESEQRL